jgi:hypothetical protein
MRQGATQCQEIEPSLGAIHVWNINTAKLGYFTARLWTRPLYICWFIRGSQRQTCSRIRFTFDDAPSTRAFHIHLPQVWSRGRSPKSEFCLLPMREESLLGII